MICKFFKGGRTFGGAKSAVNYLLNERVEKGQAKVLFGNPNITLSVIKNIKNKWKFSSGVMSFEETLSDMEKKEIIEEFKRCFFAGLEDDQYNLLIVEHTDKGRTELHFLIPRVELTTGKAFNPYWHQKDFAKKDLFQDYINAKYNLTSPHIAQKQNLIKTKQPNKNWKKNELQEWIDKYITENVEQGLIQNADDVKYFLEQAGFEITRQGKDYIGLKLENKKLRMKGAIYGKNFTGIGELARAAEERERTHRATTQREFEKLEQRYISTIQKHAESNKKRYAVRELQSIERSERDIRQHRLGAGAVQDEEKLEMGNMGRSSRDIANSRDNISNDRNNKHTIQQKHSKKSTNLEVLRNDRIRKQTNRIVRAREARQAKRDERIARYAKRTKQISDNSIKESSSTTRTKQTDITSIRESIGRYGKRQRIRRAKGIVTEFFEQIRKLTPRIIKKVQKNKDKKMDMELNEFKQQINIAEIAQVFGYYIDKEKSSRAVKQLRNDQTGDKIVVSLNQSNGHYIYFSMKDSDNGSVIDFIQRRTGKNLGQIRKVCRDWLNGKIDRTQVQQAQVVASHADRAKMARIWNNIKEAQATDWRYISKAIWERIAEKGRVKIAEDGLYFKMYDIDGVTGIEKRAFNGEKRVIAGSEKGLWSYGSLKNAKYVVFTESPIDAISYKMINKELGKDEVYIVATMGQISEKQALSIREIARFNPNAEYILATDADVAGEELANKIKKNIQSVNRNITTYRHKPDAFKDWNEELEYILATQKQNTHSTRKTQHTRSRGRHL